MALQSINLDLSSAQGIKENNLAPNEGQSASIMALLFIKLDLLSAQGIKENFLAQLDVQRVVGRAQVYRLWRSNSSIWICLVFFILMALLKELQSICKCSDYGAAIDQFGFIIFIY